jgi:hypothetical protein
MAQSAIILLLVAINTPIALQVQFEQSKSVRKQNKKGLHSLGLPTHVNSHSGKGGFRRRRRGRVTSAHISVR